MAVSATSRPPGVWWQAPTLGCLRERDNCSNFAGRFRDSIGNHFSKGSTNSTATTTTCYTELSAPSSELTEVVDMISYVGMYDGKPANKFLGKIDRATYRMPTNDWSSPESNQCLQRLHSLARRASACCSNPAECDQESQGYECEDSQSHPRVDVLDRDDSNLRMEQERKERLNQEHHQSNIHDHSHHKHKRKTNIVNKFMKLKRDVSVISYKLKKVMRKKHRKNKVVNNNKLISAINREIFITESISDMSDDLIIENPKRKSTRNYQKDEYLYHINDNNSDCNCNESQSITHRHGIRYGLLSDTHKIANVLERSPLTSHKKYDTDAVTHRHYTKQPINSNSVEAPASQSMSRDDHSLHDTPQQSRDDTVVAPLTSASITSCSNSTEAEQLNHTLKVVFLGSGNNNFSNSLPKYPHYDQEVKKSSKPGIRLSVKKLSPSDDNRNSMNGNSSSSSSSIIDRNMDLSFSLWEMEGLAKDNHHATQSICFSPDSLYIIVYKVPAISHNTDVCTCDDAILAEDEAVQTSEQELHRHMDEHFFSWIDLLSKRALEGCAVLPVVSFGEAYNYGSDDNELSKWIQYCRDTLKKRILEETSSSLKIMIPRIFPSRSDRSLEHALCSLVSSSSVFHHHLHKVITPLISCVRKIVSSYRKAEYSILHLDELHVKVVDNFAEITDNEIIDALKFLSSVGDILFFTKEEDGLRGSEASLEYSNQSVLSKFIILKPGFLGTAVSCVLRNDWKVIRNNLNDTVHRRGSNARFLDDCIRSDKSSCPILSPQVSASIWKNVPHIKETQDRISKLSSDDLLSYLTQMCEHCGIFVPFLIDEVNIPDSFTVRYLLPGLYQDDPEFFCSFKSKETWKTTLCQSWLLKDRVPCGLFDQVIITALKELGRIVNVNQHNVNINNMTTEVRVSQVLCWKTALYTKLIKKEEGQIKEEDKISFVEIFIYLVRSDSLQCPGSHTLERGTKLVVSAKGNIAHDCDIIWTLGYRNILDSIEEVVKAALGVKTEREVSCPGCMSKSDPCKANVWKVDSNLIYEQTDPTMLCSSGHIVSTKMIYGYCSSPYSSIANTCFMDHTPGKITEELLGAVVLVGLWDTIKECIVKVGSGFIADRSAGLVMTAGHIFYNLEGYENARAVIGTIHKSNEGDTAFFTYSAAIMTQDVTNVDAIVLRIITKFKDPVQCPSFSLKLQSESPIYCGKFKCEKTKSLKLMKPRIDEWIRIIGFIQLGGGIHEQGQTINHTPSVTKGYVCNIKESVSHIVQYSPEIFSPCSEITVECISYQGQSGGPCVNQDGKVIGMVSRRNPNDQRICYLVPISELEKLLKNAKRRIVT